MSARYLEKKQAKPGEVWFVKIDDFKRRLIIIINELEQAKFTVAYIDNESINIRNPYEIELEMENSVLNKFIAVDCSVLKKVYYKDLISKVGELDDEGLEILLHSIEEINGIKKRNSLITNEVHKSEDGLEENTKYERGTFLHWLYNIEVHPKILLWSVVVLMICAVLSFFTAFPN